MRKKKVEEGCRSNGEGTLVLRGRTWHARWMVNGKLYTRTTKCSNKEDAEKKLAEFVKPFQEESTLEVLENMSAKIRVQEKRIEEAKAEAKLADQKKMRLDELVDVYVCDVSTSKLSQSTINNYEVMVCRLTSFLKKKHVHEVTADDATNFLEYLKAHVCAVAFNCTLVFLRSSFNIAMKKDYRIKKNPWEGFTKLKVDKSHSRRALTAEEVEKLISTAESTSSINNNKEVALVFKVAAYTGMRLSDCCCLKWSSIDFETNMIRYLPIKTKKTGLVAVVPLHPKLKEVLMKIPRKGEYVDEWCKDEYFSKQIRKQIKQVFIEAGVETSEVGDDGKQHVVTGFHALRTTFISNCAKDGIPLPSIQKMVAHSRIDMTMNYTRTNDSDLRLPNVDEVKVSLKKSTYDLIRSKLAEGQSFDDFMLKLMSQA